MPRGELIGGNMGPVSSMGSMGSMASMGSGGGLEAELTRVHAMLAHNSKVYKVFIYTMHLFYFLFNFISTERIFLLMIDFA